jgi:hypothetical protein
MSEKVLIVLESLWLNGRQSTSKSLFINMESDKCKVRLTECGLRWGGRIQFQKASFIKAQLFELSHKGRKTF